MAKNKKGICMADGGITKETPDQLMARMSAKYGAPAAGPVQSAPVQQPAPQPVPKPQAPQQGIAAGIRGMFGNRQQQLDEQERKANGMANGGIVRGKGTPTSDDVPVKIKGEDYNLSDTEAVLPSKTRQALGEMLGAKPGDVAQANKLVEAFIEKTNGKPPVSVNDGVNLANGGLLDEESRKMDYQAVTGVQAPAPMPVKPNFGDNSQAGLDARLAAMQAANGTTPVNTASGPTVSDGAGGVYTPEVGSKPGTGILSGITNLFADSAKAARTGVPYSQVQAEREASAAAAPAPAATAAPSGEFKQDPFAASQPKFPVGESPATQFITGKDGARPDSSGGGFTQGATSYNVNPTSQDGIAKVTAQGKNPLYTNIKPEDAVSGLKNQTIGGNAADVQQGLDRFARANAIRQEMIDSQPAGGIAILGDGGVEAANAEKTARWRQDDLISKAARNPAAGQVALASANGQNAMGVEEMRQQGDAARNAVAMRGQDIALARADGSPEERQLKQAQAKGIMATTESTQMLADLQKKALAGDAQAAASYRALTGKGGADYKDRFISVPGGEEIGPDGMTKIKRPSGVFDAQQGKFVSMSGEQQGGQAVPAADKREVGKTYQTPKGPMVWRGNGWEAAQ